jgi:hypothetical protein
VSKKERVYGLGKKAGELLMDLANVPDWPDHFNPAETVSSILDRHEQHSEWIERLRRPYRDVLGDCSRAEIITLCRLLRRVWTESLLDKEWFVFLLRQFYAGIIRHTSPTTDEIELLVAQHQSAREALDAIFRRPSKEDVTRGVLDFLRQQAVIDTYASEPPTRTSAFDDCLLFLLRKLHLLRICQRAKKCEVRPYFIADKPRQKYCSDICAREVRLACKKDWWKRNRGKGSTKKRRK